MAKKKKFVIDPKNYFDANSHAPQEGQVLVSYKRSIDLIDSSLKREIISLLKSPGGAGPAVDAMSRNAAALQPEAIKLCLEMTEDPKNGMTDQAVAEKSYSYIALVYLYTFPQFVPDDPNWQIIAPKST